MDARGRCGASASGYTGLRRGVKGVAASMVGRGPISNNAGTFAPMVGRAVCGAAVPCAGQGRVGGAGSHPRSATRRVGCTRGSGIRREVDLALPAGAAASAYRSNGASCARRRAARLATVTSAAREVCSAARSRPRRVRSRRQPCSAVHAVHVCWRALRGDSVGAVPVWRIPPSGGIGATRLARRSGARWRASVREPCRLTTVHTFGGGGDVARGARHTPCGGGERPLRQSVTLR